MKKERTYLVPVVWQEAGTMRIVADSLEEAMKIAREEAELPKDADYLCDSLVVDEESPWFGDYEDNDISYINEDAHDNL